MSDNYFASVGVIVIKDNKVLLVRHTYGSAAGKLLNPGGYLNFGETPFEAAKREVLEETGVIIEPKGVLAIQTNSKNWYMVISADYISGEPHSDNSENSEALFMDCNELLNYPQATDTVKRLVRLALENKPMEGIDVGKGRTLFSVDSIK